MLGPGGMSSIYLVAEADSGSPGGWPGPGQFRPLTRQGWRQARTLARELGGRPITRVLSSTHLRCRQTVLPLADALDAEIECDRDLAEAAGVERATARVLALWSAEPILVCTHFDLAQGVVDRLSADNFARAEPCLGSPVPAWVLRTSS